MKIRKSLLLKSSIGIFLITALLTTALISALVIFARKALYDSYKKSTLRLAETTAQLVDGDYIATYLDTMETDELYYNLFYRLKTIAEVNEVDSIYIEKIDLEQQTAETIMTPSESEEFPLGMVTPLMEPFRNKPMSEIMRHPYIGDTEYGELCCAFVPIYDCNGNYIVDLGVEMEMERVHSHIRNTMLFIVLISIVIAISVTLVTNFLIVRFIIRPVKRLSDAVSCYDTNMLMMDGLQTMLSRLENHTGDEIEELTVSVQKMEADIKHYVCDLTAATAANERVSAELNIATGIQASMLPNAENVFEDRSDFDLFATMHPAKEVGGDFFDFFLLDYDHLAVIAADVSGKGVPAALFMAIAKTMIRNHALQGLSPEQVFRKVNMQLCENNQKKMFVTAWMGILELSTGKVSFANAGHTRPIIVRKDGASTYVRSKANFVLAGMPMMQYQPCELQLQPGDTLFLYTDGVTEATNAANELYGEKRLLETISAHPDDSPEMMIAAIKDSIDGFVKDAPQFDDITMLAVRFNGGQSGEYTETKTFTAEAAALDQVLEWLEALLMRYDCPMKVQTQLCIAAEELFVNIASYGYPHTKGSVDLTCRFSGEPTVLALTFIDNGMPYDPLKQKAPDTTLGPDERKPGGLGIFMVKKTMDAMKYRYENGQNILTITKTLR